MAADGEQALNGDDGQTGESRMDATADTTGADTAFLGPDTETTPVLSFVLPTMNEASGIGPCLDAIERVVTELGVTAEVIVSDSSTDETPEIARERGAIVVEPDRPGYGYAYRYAFARARGELVVMGDADTTYDFRELPRLLDTLEREGADIVIGDRFGGEIKPGAMPPLHQYLGNPALTAFLNVFYDADVNDAHCGLRVLTREALERLDLAADGMEFASEMIMDASVRDLTIAEVPITYHPRAGESTLESLADGWHHLRFMLVNAPGYLYSYPGLAAVVVGVALMLLAFFDATLTTPAGRPVWFGVRTMVAGSLLTIAGYQVTSLGAFATSATDPIRRPDNRVTAVLADRISVEQGLALGGLLLMGGVGYSLVLVATWLRQGYNALPPLTHDILAFTVIVLGVQTVFAALFVGSLGRR
jgi:glycosyltransferase involved in cell wall biosynthesis